MMWKFTSDTFARLKKNPIQTSRAFSECSDDELCSVTSREEGLECPICLESFNIVENVPYVLWCGHTLCKNCVLGLQCAVLRFASHEINIPFFISCPWCHLLSVRLVSKGNLNFPRKNFFILWMVECLSGDRVDFCSSRGDDQPIWSPKGNLVVGNQPINNNLPGISYSHCPGQLHSNSDNASNVERHHFSFHKSLDFFFHFTSKVPLVVMFLLVVFFAIPSTAIILALYLILTVIFAIPSVLVLYFMYPALQWLIREITS